MSLAQYLKEDSQHGIYPPSPQHVFSRGRCLHCGTDDHSLPEAGEEFASWELACPVDGEDRKSVWSFGPEGSDLTDDELDELPHHSPLF